MGLINNDTIIYPYDTYENAVRKKLDLYVRRFLNGRWSAVRLGRGARKAIDNHQLKYLALYRSGKGYMYIEEYAEIIKYEKIDASNIHKYDNSEPLTDDRPQNPLWRIFLKNMNKLPHKIVRLKGTPGIQFCKYTTLAKLKNAKDMSQI